MVPSMPVLRQPLSVLASWPTIICLQLALAACPSGDDDDTTPPEEDPWVVEQTGLAGVALSIWGNDSSDVWVTGADAGSGPELVHRDGTSWSSLDTGHSGDLWWVVGDGDHTIWLVGDDGAVLKHDRAAGTFDQIETDTPATLYGAWVAPSGTVYAVGGSVGDSSNGPVLLRIVGDVAEEVTGLPASVSVNESFFKVWGSGDNDVWVISDFGSVLHFDGATWSFQTLPDNPRLVTIHGSGPEDIAIVGGMTQAMVFELDGILWRDVSPPAGQPLNGVFVTADGGGFGAGGGNFLMERTAFDWAMVEGSFALGMIEWHGVWIDEDGEPWLVGGDLIDLVDGVVARRVTQ